MTATPQIIAGQDMKVLLGIWGDELNRSSLHFVAIDSQLSPPSVSEVDCYLAHRSRVSRVSTLLVATIQSCEIGQKKLFWFLFKWIATWHRGAESVGIQLCWSPQFSD